ncbi:MAG: hypothetical protein HOA53_18375 [Anaerolineae bacterium]|jgi:4-amino-4-deoxy-L-arabinose transferase-like glycosyltransferase|nr:hypothetical protein [Anaerolineae bacterium]MBT6323262.1 hypothetical protein [Anaerolineae bacterium]MBT6814590.1 hypothetical protein [Anaerolineae bacterium]
MKKNYVPDFLRKIALVLLAFFPIALSLFFQIVSIINTWELLRLFQFASLIVVFFAPMLVVFINKSVRKEIKKYNEETLFWVIVLAFILRIILVQVISTNFVSDFEDVHSFASDIYFGNTLANLSKYPNIPYSLHLNMPSFVLSIVYKLFGPSTNVAKLFMVLLGVITTFLIYLNGKEISNETVGLLSAFLFAILPSTICYSGTLDTVYLAFPPLLLATLLYIRSSKNNDSNLPSSVIYFSLIGILIGITDWFRPVGIILIIALIISLLIYKIKEWKNYKLLIIIGIVLLSYTGTTNLAAQISKNIFQTNILSSSQRIGEYLLKGLNPISKGRVTTEDYDIAVNAYARFNGDSFETQKYLVNLAFSRLDKEGSIELFKSKIDLIWASHDALFDYSLIGSNDDELVNLLRDFETLLWVIITVFMFFNVVFAIKENPSPATFTMQLFILGFALLLLFMEVQNRYVAIVIPFSILLSVSGLDTVLKKIKYNENIVRILVKK